MRARRTGWRTDMKILQVGDAQFAGGPPRPRRSARIWKFSGGPLPSGAPLQRQSRPRTTVSASVAPSFTRFWDDTRGRQATRRGTSYVLRIIDDYGVVMSQRFKFAAARTVSVLAGTVLREHAHVPPPAGT